MSFPEPHMGPAAVSEAIERIGMTKVKLGARIGVTTETLRSWEAKGVRGPGAVALAAYASGWRP